MMSSRGISFFLQSVRGQSKFRFYRAMSSGETGTPGEGAGHGGGAGGTIREAGGSFGKREAALEEQYMREQQNASLKELKKNLGSKKPPSEEPVTKPVSDNKDESSTSSTSSKTEGALRGTQGGLAKRKTALEDQYFRNQGLPKKDK